MKFNLIALIAFLFISSSTSSQDLSEKYKKSIKSVVTIFTTEFKFSGEAIKQNESLGSGVIIDDSGLILTAAHVVETANTINVKLHNGNTYKAEIVRSVPTADVALIKIIEDVPGLDVAEMNALYNTVETGHQVYIIGSPLGIEQSLSSGYVSGFLKRNILANGNMAKYIQTDAAINQGNSGGPMFDMEGRVIGIVSFILSQSGGFDGIGYAVDIETAKELLIEDDIHFWSGFDGYFLDNNLAAALNVPQEAGLLVQRVTHGSFAETMGLKAGFFQVEIFDHKLWLGGDIILEILGSKCDNPHSLGSIKEEIKNMEEGDLIYLKVLRQGKILNLEKAK